MLDKFYPVGSWRYLLMLLFCMVTRDIWAQGRTENNWVFGNTGQLLQFNFLDDTLSDQLLPIEPFASQGSGNSAVATDPVSGEILFYTDGARLYDAQGQPFGPASLDGNPDGSQQVAIAPVPGDDGSDGVLEYYVFVRTSTGAVRYYTVQVNVAGNGFPTASVASGPANTGVTGASGSILVIPNADQSGYWVVTQLAGTATYQVINTANPSAAPATYNLAGQGAGAITATNMAYHEATGQIAVASDQGIHILNIDAATGQVTYDNALPGAGAVYDVAWSADGSKLYYSTGADGRVFQYDAEEGTVLNIPALASANGSYGLKLGPDGNIYYLYQDADNTLKLGRITDADSTLNLISTELGLFNGTDFGSTQFSEITPGPAPTYEISFKQVGNCANNPVQLIPEFPEGTPVPDSIVWYLGNQTFRGTSPTFTPDQTTPVGVIAYWDGDSAAFSGAAQVQDFQLQVPLVQDTTICPGDVAVLKANPDSGGQQGGGQPGGGGGSYTYYWSTGAVTDTIHVSEAGVYWVVVTDNSTGCAAYAESNVKEYQIENQTYNVWYFGDGAGIDFNTLYDPDNPQGGQITPLGDGAQTAPEAVASVSDPNGDILFYTDGQTVYFKDRTTGDHVQLAIAEPPGATEIGGDPTATQVAIVPVPNTDGLYYIFTTTEVENGGYELKYSIFDLRNLQIVSSNNLLFAKSTERIAIFGGNGSNAVLLAHEYGNNTFRAYPITAEGIGQPVMSNVGSIHSFDSPEEAEGYMKFGGDSTGTVVAVAVNDRVEVFNFDGNTLKLSEPVTIDLSGNGRPYGVEFYADTLGNTVLLMSTDQGLFTATIDRPIEEGDVIPVIDPGVPGNFGAIQQGSDGQTYITTPGSSSLGTVTLDANNPQNVTYTPDAVQLPDGATTQLGLPNEVRTGGNSFPEPNISVDNACVGSEVNFSAQGRDDVIETYYWELIRLNDDGTRTNIGLPDSLATSQTFSYAVDTLGNFLAQVTLSNPCDEDSIMTQEFTMNDGVEVTLPESINLCQGTIDVSAVDPADDDGTLTFSWVQVGQVGGGNLPAQNTITITEGGTYQVTVTTAEGCTSDGEVFVVDNRPPVELPEDFTLCQGESRQLDVEIPSPADPGYEWVILDNNGTQVSTSNEPVIEVGELTSQPGVYLYTVTVTDDSPEGCFVQDTVVVTILGQPLITLSPQATSGCGLTDGGIALEFQNGDDPNLFSYSWRNSSGAIVSTDQNLTGQPAGIYTVTVTNANGCNSQASAAIDDNFGNFEIASVTPSINAGCEDNEGTITVEIDEASSPPSDLYPMSWTLSGDTLISGSTNSNTFTLTSLPSGTYHLEMRSQIGCVQNEANIIIDPVGPSNEVQFNAPRQVNACDVSADVVVDFTPDNINLLYSWYRPDGTPITENQAGADSVRVFESGTYTVEVSDPRNPALCPGSREIRVSIEEPFNANIREVEPDNSCQTGEKQITIDFEPTDAENGDYIYNWTLDGNPILEAGRTITVTQSGEYGVRVRRRNSACFATDSEPIQVNQPVSVNIFFNAVCDDGSDVPLFASVRLVGSDSVTYAWFGPEGNRIPAGNTRGDSLLVNPTMPEGEYRVVVTTTGGCTAEASATIRRNPVPVVNFEGDRFVICSQDPDPEVNSVELSVAPAPVIVWTLPNGTQLFNTPTVVADAGGIYRVEVTNNYGCTTIDSVQVVDDCQPRIVAPNAFRPEGKNNEFFVYHRYVSEDDFEVQIYNRWGELIFQSNDRDFRWDGTYKGREAPLGTYPYVIHYKASTSTTEDGRSYEHRGGITVLR